MSSGIDIDQQLGEYCIIGCGQQIAIIWEGKEYNVFVSGYQADKNNLQCWSREQIDPSWNLSPVFKEYTNLVPIQNIIL